MRGYDHVSRRSHPRTEEAPVATDLTALLDDLRAEQADLRALVVDAELDAPTPAKGWSVRDAVAHLAGSDAEAHTAATRPEDFLAALPGVAKDIDGFLTGQLTSRRDLSRTQLLDGWQSGFDAMVEAFASVPPGTKVPWYGPPMSPPSFATARLMEYWAHGQDVADGLGAPRTPTARLRHIAHLGVRTRGFAFVNRGLEPDPTPVALVLTAPDGSDWHYGDPVAQESVTGSALDFCLLVTQRRHRADLDLVATGAAADRWLDLAQCFAGPPGSGRPPTTEHR